jgi:F-type H+-transporting ATPase subunit gamma
MAQTTAIKNRIKSVKNTRQITKAMELVAASKMRRAQDAALRSRDFHNLARQILTRLRETTDVTKHPLYRNRKIKTRLHLLITSNQGLAGAYDGNTYKQFMNELIADRDAGIRSQVIVIGKKGERFVSTLKNVEVIASYVNFPEHPTANDISPILMTMIDKFRANEIDAVDVIYTYFKSSISQQVRSLRLLPAAFQEIEISPELDQAEIEPSPQEVLDSVTERLIEAQLNQAFLESIASEQSMRMIAMKNASDNASDLIDDYTLAFNTARQSAITQELAEITGGAEAMK